MLKIGDKVKITDGSWSLVVTNSGLKSTGYICGVIYEVLAVGCNLPSSDKEKFNNTIIFDKKTSRTFFVQERFCEKIEQEVEYVYYTDFDRSMVWRIKNGSTEQIVIGSKNWWHIKSLDKENKMQISKEIADNLINKCSIERSICNEIFFKTKVISPEKKFKNLNDFYNNLLKSTTNLCIQGKNSSDLSLRYNLREIASSIVRAIIDLNL